jgi:hypothetical protein
MSDIQSGTLGGEKRSRRPFHYGERQAPNIYRAPQIHFLMSCAEPRSRPLSSLLDHLSKCRKPRTHVA